jgi:hypothetical protein
MHVLLLLALGPLGLGHKPAVLIWNVYFILQNFVLFRGGRAPRAVPTPAPDLRLPVFNGLATAIVLLVIAAPLLEPFGWFDHWPAWAVYSSRPAIVTVSINNARVAELPASARAHVGPPGPLSDWRLLNIDAWSYSALHCPVYPQERFRLSVARAVAEEAHLGDDIRVVVHSPADRRGGGRTASPIAGAEALLRMCRQFLVNTRRRDSATWLAPPPTGGPASRPVTHAPRLACRTPAHRIGRVNGREELRV